MKLTEKEFKVLDALDNQEISTQRQLADHTGISLGQINYLLKSLLNKGLVKVGNFRKNPKKIGYLYLLTPKGFEEKSSLAVNFVIKKLNEYNSIQDKLSERLFDLEMSGRTRIIFVGPSIVKDFVVSIIKNKDLKLSLVQYCNNLEELTNIDSNTYDIVLLFDGNAKKANGSAANLGIPAKKLLPLW